MVVAEASASAASYDQFLSLTGYLAQHFARLRIAAYASQGHFEHLILTRAPRAEILAAMFAVFGKDVLGVFEVKESPALGGAAQYDVPSTATIAAVGSRLGVVFHPQQVCRPSTALARAHQDLYIVYKIGGHLA